MVILSLLEQLGWSPKRTASTNGGEYHSPCPNCMEGIDRLCIWPKQGKGGRYWCRQCGSKGDAIQFCRDFLGLSFKDACQRVGSDSVYQCRSYQPRINTFSPREVKSPSVGWSNTASHFIKECNEYIWKDPCRLKNILDRGLNQESIKSFRIGWNPRNRWESRDRWGIGSEGKKQWLPKGWVIPVFQDGDVPVKLKIRRSDWVAGERYPKYIEVSGSKNQFAVFGKLHLPVVLVEAEFDAMLIAQEAGDICCPISLGGAGKKPDAETHQFLKCAPKLLFSLDHDEAGKKAFVFWRKNYSNLVPWPVPKGKSPEEAHLMGVDIYRWVMEGLTN